MKANVHHGPIQGGACTCGCPIGNGDTVLGLADTIRFQQAEVEMLARQLHSIAQHVGRARLGWVRVSAINQLLITDPADEEAP